MTNKQRILVINGEKLRTAQRLITELTCSIDEPEYGIDFDTAKSWSEMIQIKIKNIDEKIRSSISSEVHSDKYESSPLVNLNL